MGWKYFRAIAVARLTTVSLTAGRDERALQCLCHGIRAFVGSHYATKNLQRRADGTLPR